MCLSVLGECGNAVFSVTPITEDLSVQYDTEASHGLFSFVKACLPLMLSAGLCVLSPPGPEHLQGWERRLRLSFCLAISSFKKTERREDSTDPHFSICQEISPSIRETLWVYTPSFPNSVHGYARQQVRLG